MLVGFTKNSLTEGIQLFTEDGKCVLEAGSFDYETTEIVLQEGDAS